MSPISPNAFTANVSKATTKIEGSSSGRLIVRSNCRPVGPALHSVPIMPELNHHEMSVASLALIVPHSRHHPPNEITTGEQTWRRPNRSIAQWHQRPDNIVLNWSNQKTLVDANVVRRERGGEMARCRHQPAIQPGPPQSRLSAIQFHNN